MNRYFVSIITVTLLIALIALISVKPGFGEERRELRPVLINLTSGAADIQQVSAAITLANDMREAGRSVTLFINSHALDLVNTRQPDVALFGRRTMLRAALGTLMGEGLEVLACPTSVRLAGISADDLMDGVGIADRDTFIDLLDGGAAVFSY